MNRFAVGVVCALIGAASWGFSGTCAQYLFAHCEISSLFITVVRGLGAGALFLIVCLARHRSTILAMLHDRSTRWRLLVFGCAGIYFAQLLYLVCIDYTNAGTATVLQALNVVFVLLFVCATARRLPRLTEFAAILIAFGAVLLIATKGDFGSLQVSHVGLVFGILSAMTAAIYVAYPKKLFERWGSLPVTGLGMLASGILALVVFLGAGVLWDVTGGALGESAMLAPLSPDCVVVLALIVLVGTFASFGLYLHGVSIIGGVKGSLLGLAEPVSATVIASVWLGTAFTWADWAGMALMMVTVLIVSLQKK